LSSVVTLLVYRFAWATSVYELLLLLLLGLSVVLAARVLRRTGLRLWPILGVAAGILVGQWWAIQMIAVLIWMLNGFAP
jgi:predicted membrane protein